MAKKDIAYIRVKASELVREIRSDFPTLKGDWTHKQWNAQARKAGRAYIKNTLHFLALNKD